MYQSAQGCARLCKSVQGYARLYSAAHDLLAPQAFGLLLQPPIPLTLRITKLFTDVLAGGADQRHTAPTGPIWDPPTLAERALLPPSKVADSTASDSTGTMSDSIALGSTASDSAASDGTVSDSIGRQSQPS